jgi:hypothetical protein
MNHKAQEGYNAEKFGISDAGEFIAFAHCCRLRRSTATAATALFYFVSFVRFVRFVIRPCLLSLLLS